MIEAAIASGVAGVEPEGVAPTAAGEVLAAKIVEAPAAVLVVCKRGAAARALSPV
jgi:O-acetyl-ADP-ribose deacetylase (regulator of RNase III)